MAAEAPAVSDKQVAVEAIQRMPETVSLPEIAEEMAILAAVHRGECA